jgi:hypothetical protein
MSRRTRRTAFCPAVNDTSAMAGEVEAWAESSGEFPAAPGAFACIARGYGSCANY